jgi:Flp pilus assembly protein TadG
MSHTRLVLDQPDEGAVMTVRQLVSALRRCTRSFAADRHGVSVVEFALLLPLMLTMFFGSIEVTDAISADRQVTLVASTVADIASQYSSVAASDVSNIMAAATSVLAPFSTANVQVTLTSVLIDNSGNATVDWSSTLNGTPRSGTVTSAIPAALRPANVSTCTSPGPSCVSVLWGEATYAYKPVIGWVITGTLNMSNQIFMRPRLSNCVHYTGAC